MHRRKVRPFRGNFMEARLSTAVRRRFSTFAGRRVRTGSRAVISLTNEVVAGHKGKGINFTRLRSDGNRVRVCMHGSIIKRRSCTVFGRTSLKSVVNMANPVVGASTNRIAVGPARLIRLAGTLHPLPSGCRNLAGIRRGCHRHCLSLVDGGRDFGGFIRHDRVVDRVEACLGKLNCLRIRAPALRGVTNKTATEPFVARRGTLSVRLCVHVTLRLRLGHLIVNNVRGICRVNHMFHGRKVSAARGPRFAVLRVCATCASFRSIVRIIRNVFRAIAAGIGNSSAMICSNARVGLTNPCPHVRVISTIGTIANISF